MLEINSTSLENAEINSLEQKIINENRKILNKSPIIEKVMGPGCVYCRFKCHSEVTRDEREELFKKFCSLKEHSLKWQYIDKMIVNFEPKHRGMRFEDYGNPRRKLSRHYYLDTGVKRQKVCQKMFLDTFGK